MFPISLIPDRNKYILNLREKLRQTTISQLLAPFAGALLWVVLSFSLYQPPIVSSWKFLNFVGEERHLDSRIKA